MKALQTFVSLVFITLQIISGQEQSSFNLKTATCFNPKETAQINLFMEWSAFDDSGSDGFCLDNQGTGYASNQTFISCSGCMKYVCTYRPCEDRDGSKWKMFWTLESVAKSCCQDCGGQVISPNKVFSTTKLVGECTVFKHAMCQTSAVTKSGTIEVSYESTNCCADTAGWISSNSP